MPEICSTFHRQYFKILFKSPKSFLDNVYQQFASIVCAILIIFLTKFKNWHLHSFFQFCYIILIFSIAILINTHFRLSNLVTNKQTSIVL